MLKSGRQSRRQDGHDRAVDDALDDVGVSDAVSASRRAKASNV
jgi:hypothetical protein